MKKEITICFRTNEELRGALEMVAREDRRSLSSAIELILTDYLKKHHDFLDRKQQERRRFPRKQVAIPAYVRKHDLDTVQQHGAVVLDLSLGGACFSVPKECLSEIYGGEESRFEASFVIPEGNRAVRVVCKPQRVMPLNGNAYVGASFVDADFTNYQRMQEYLV